MVSVTILPIPSAGNSLLPLAIVIGFRVDQLPKQFKNLFQNQHPANPTVS
jgi:hypothetical protein